jgi:hypothetical protein
MPSQGVGVWAKGIPAFLVVTSITLALVYRFVDPGMQPLIVRAVVAVVLAIVLFDLIGRLREYGRRYVSTRAGHSGGSASGLDPLFVVLERELRDSRRDRRYFERILWPRLQSLAEHHSPRESPQPPPPADWPFWRWGPSWPSLAELIRRIEGKT